MVFVCSEDMDGDWQLIDGLPIVARPPGCQRNVRAVCTADAAPSCEKRRTRAELPARSLPGVLHKRKVGPAAGKVPKPCAEKSECLTDQCYKGGAPGDLGEEVDDGWIVVGDASPGGSLTMGGEEKMHIPQSTCSGIAEDWFLVDDASLDAAATPLPPTPAAQAAAVEAEGGATCQRCESLETTQPTRNRACSPSLSAAGQLRWLSRSVLHARGAGPGSPRASQEQAGTTLGLEADGELLVGDTGVTDSGLVRLPLLPATLAHVLSRGSEHLSNVLLTVWPLLLLLLGELATILWYAVAECVSCAWSFRGAVWSQPGQALTPRAPTMPACTTARGIARSARGPCPD